jgi:hypothetical protein
MLSTLRILAVEGIAFGPSGGTAYITMGVFTEAGDRTSIVFIWIDAFSADWNKAPEAFDKTCGISDRNDSAGGPESGTRSSTTNN